MYQVIAKSASESLPADRIATMQFSSAQKLFAAALWLALLSALALFVDAPVARFLKEHGVGGDLKRLIRLAEVFGWGGSVALIVLCAAVLDPRGWRLVPFLVASSWGAGLIADGIKLLVARQRPSTAALELPVVETFAGWLPLASHAAFPGPYGHAMQSFPSAHAATAAGLATALAVLYPRGRWLFAVFAILACIQRLEAQAHFTSDILAGAALGCLVGATCICLFPAVVAARPAN